MWRAAAGALALLALAGCGADDRAPSASSQRPDSETSGLPQPARIGGAVTGMPDQPGPGDVPLGGEQPAPALVDEGLAPLEDNPETGLLLPGDFAPAAAVQSAPEPAPAPEDAAAVIRSYYAAINALDYPRAYALWSDGGRSSGQSPEQFAAGFARTSTVMVDIGAPGAVQAAGSAHLLQLPVSLQAQQADGTIRRYEGHYVLRSGGVDGADRRAWRIASVDLRETSSP